MVNQKLLNYALMKEDDIKDVDVANAIGDISIVLSTGEFSEYNETLKAIPIGSMSVVMMITFLRTAFMARNNLTEWHKFLIKAHKEVGIRGKDADKTFQGLSLEYD